MSQNKVFIALIIVLLIGNVFFASRYFVIQRELTIQRVAVDVVNFNSRVVSFTTLFIDKVLKEKGEVSFEERLNLETEVRNLKDAEILAQWNKFTSSNSEAQAQEEVKNLLSLLVSKIKR